MPTSKKFVPASVVALRNYSLEKFSADAISGVTVGLVALPLAMVASALAALAIGALSVRTSGIYFIMVTMAFAQMVFYLFFDNKVLGGSDGIYINFKPDAVLFDLENKQVFYFFTLACLVGVYLFLRRLLWSPLGRALNGIRIQSIFELD